MPSKLHPRVQSKIAAMASRDKHAVLVHAAHKISDGMCAKHAAIMLAAYKHSDGISCHTVAKNRYLIAIQDSR